MRKTADTTLLAVLVVEIAIFSLIAERFFSVGNLFEVLRLSVELGLLAVALTPILITGGIDLSVGSMMGLRRSSSAPRRAISDCRCRLRRCCAIGTGLAGGALNGAADHAAAAAAADRDARILLALSRHRRGDHRRLGQLQRIRSAVPRARPGLHLGPHPRAARDPGRGVRRLRGAAPSIDDRPRAVHDRLRRSRRALCRAFPSRGGSASSTCSRD